MKILVTGSAGFIGYHICERLLDDGHHVIGFDAMTPYYNTVLKEARLTRLKRRESYTAVAGRLEDEGALDGLAADVIVHLAGQAGVRYGLENPKAYIDSNLVGSWRLLEHACQIKPRHVLIASSSSIYGANAKVPFEEGDRADEPISLYAATKKGMEALAHAYAHLHAIPLTAFRFFTVYGPWGRPDMALFKFTRAILAGEAIEVYGGGQMQRDFTYIGDLVEAIMRLLGLPPSLDGTPYRTINIGGGQPVGLNDFIEILEQVIGRKAIRRDLPMQPGDVPRTYASPARLISLTGYVPGTPLRQGIEAFVSWYRGYHGV